MIAVQDITNANKQLSVTIEPLEMDLIQLTQSDIQNNNSVTINNKAVSGSDFEFGAVFAGECSFSFRTNIDRYKIYDAKVTVQCGNGVDTVNKGVYYIADAIRTGNYISVTAYDGMIFLDKDIEDNTTGSVFDLLSYVAEKCGIELAQTQEEIASLPNATIVYSVQSDLISRYRDLVYYLAKVTCTFATFDGDGKLRLCQFHTEVDMTIDKNGRTKPEIADYKVYYEGATARFILSGKTYETYTAQNSDVAKRFYDFGDIPIVRQTSDVHSEIIQNMLSEVLKIEYVPVAANIRFNPFIELGDRIQLLDTNSSGETVNSYVMSYEWSFRGSTKLKSVGSNPLLSSTKSKEEKQLENISKSVNAKDIIVHSYTNASALKITDNKEIEIVSVNFATVAFTKPIFIATIPFTMDLDGNVIIRYYLDGVLIEDDILIKYAPRGNHFVTISNNLQMDANTRMTLKVTMQTEYFESDNRQLTAKILAFEDYINSGIYAERDADTTAPTASIAKGSIKAVLYSQGLAGTEAWDGTINIADEMAKVTLSNNITVAEMSDAVSVGLQTPTPATISDVFAPVKLSNTITILGMTDVVEFAVEESEE